MEEFYVPSDVRDWCMASTRRGKLNHEQWNQELAIYSNSNPELYKQFMQFFDRKTFEPDKILKNAYKWEGMSGRDINKQILNEVASRMLQVVGGTADLAISTRAIIDSASNFIAANKRGRNIRFGVREHSMVAICNGIALYEDFIPFCSTFLSFSNYMLPSIRMAAYMKLGILYFFTHDSIYVGQDGPSHQPIEQLGQLRSIIGLNVFRPCDANEILAGYSCAINRNGPTAIVLAKQKLDNVDGTTYKNALSGGYILKSAKKNAKIVIYATGSEVALALQVAEELSKKTDVSVVSMPCLEIFEQQSTAYKSKVLQKDAKLRVAIEASNDSIWNKYVGENGLIINVEDYAQSGDGQEIYERAGFNVREIVKKINKKLGKD